MKKNLRPAAAHAHFICARGEFEMSIENFKRRRALPLSIFLGDSKFFDHVLNVRRGREVVFITKAAEKNR